MKRGTRLIIKPINSSCGTRDRRVESGTVDKRDPDPDFPPENRLAPRFASTAPSAFPLQRGNRAIGSLPLCNRNYIYDTWRQHTDISIRIRRRLYSSLAFASFTNDSFLLSILQRNFQCLEILYISIREWNINFKKTILPTFSN